MTMKRFKNVLLKVYPYSVKDQEKVLLSFLTKWMGGCPQVDDITLMGIKCGHNVNLG